MSDGQEWASKLVTATSDYTSEQERIRVAIRSEVAKLRSSAFRLSVLLSGDSAAGIVQSIRNTAEDALLMSEYCVKAVAESETE